MAVKKAAAPPADDSEQDDSDSAPGRYVQIDARVIERILEQLGSQIGGLFNAVPTLSAGTEKPQTPDTSDSDGGTDDEGSGDGGDDKPAAPERKPRGKRNIFLD